jgi:hypothetical protein
MRSRENREAHRREKSSADAYGIVTCDSRQTRGVRKNDVHLVMIIARIARCRDGRGRRKTELNIDPDRWCRSMKREAEVYRSCKELERSVSCRSGSKCSFAKEKGHRSDSHAFCCGVRSEKGLSTFALSASCD